MIVADYREEKSGVVDELKKLGAPIKLEHLEVGDYIIGTEICIERKTCNDLVSSIVDKRLFEQTHHIVRVYTKPILVVEGDLNWVIQHRRIGYPQIYGALAALVDMGVNVLRTSSPRETAYAIYYLYKRKSEDSGKEYLPPAKIHVVKRTESLEVIQLNLLSVLPGVSKKTAHRILMHFKTPRRFFKASPSELRAIEGLGSSRIAKIIEVLDTMYPPASRDPGEQGE